ncbi:ATP-binding protein [Oceaniglobus indicus]|uniref:ATP-binding protein n=1 Tax=Oceaniglobus indicus TaxID=2047749 RepID=UPI000C174744|nr:ATP-binding protein [Oceaniglobus indicus]
MTQGKEGLDPVTRGSLNQVLAALHLPAFWVGSDNRIAVSNPAALALFDPGLVGRHYLGALRQPRIVAAIETALTAKTAAIATYWTTDRNHDTVWTARAEPLDLNRQQGVLVTLEDTTAMQEVGQMRRDFVANVSHELRTPLTALIGFIDTLRGAARDDPAARERFLATMAGEAARMNRLVQDLLSLSRLESDERMRPTGHIDFARLLASVRQSLAPLLNDSDTTLILAGCDDLPDASGDGDQIGQVFVNLVENAVKYGGTGQTVTITATPIARDPALRQAAIRFDVTDTGDGMDPVHIPRLTERFYRIDTHRSREMGGTGLGLAIVKHIVNRHRGRLHITSVPGQGSTFSVILPTK